MQNTKYKTQNAKHKIKKCVIESVSDKSFLVCQIHSEVLKVLCSQK